MLRKGMIHKIRCKIKLLRTTFILFEHDTAGRQGRLDNINGMLRKLLNELPQLRGIEEEAKSRGRDGKEEVKMIQMLRKEGHKIVEELEKRLEGFGLVKDRYSKSQGWKGLEMSRLVVPTPVESEEAVSNEISQCQNQEIADEEQYKTAEKIVIDLMDEDEDEDMDEVENHDQDENQNEIENEIKNDDDDCIITLVLDRKQNVEESWIEMGIRLRDDLLWYDHTKDFNEDLLP